MYNVSVFFPRPFLEGPSSRGFGVVAQRTSSRVALGVDTLRFILFGICCSSSRRFPPHPDPSVKIEVLASPCDDRWGVI